MGVSIDIFIDCQRYFAKLESLAGIYKQAIKKPSEDGFKLMVGWREFNLKMPWFTPFVLSQSKDVFSKALPYYSLMFMVQYSVIK